MDELGRSGKAAARPNDTTPGPDTPAFRSAGGDAADRLSGSFGLQEPDTASTDIYSMLQRTFQARNVAGPKGWISARSVDAISISAPK